MPRLPAPSLTLASKETGRDVVIVYRTFAVPLSDLDGPPRWLWSATRGAAQEAIEDKAARVAEVQAYIAAQDDPSGWDLIVLA